MKFIILYTYILVWILYPLLCNQLTMYIELMKSVSCYWIKDETKWIIQVISHFPFFFIFPFFFSFFETGWRGSNSCVCALWPSQCDRVSLQVWRSWCEFARQSEFPFPLALKKFLKRISEVHWTWFICHSSHVFLYLFTLYVL